MAGEITVGGNILASHTGIDGAGSLTLGNTVVPASSYMFRNKIINGDMRISQRSTNVGSFTADVGGSGGFKTLDRFYHELGSAGTYTLSQNSITDLAGFKKSLKVFCTASTTPSGTAQFNVHQRIESNHFYDLAFGTSFAKSINYSFWVKTNVAGDYILWFLNVPDQRMTSKKYTISSDETGSWKHISVTVNGDTGGSVFDADNSHAFQVRHVLASGGDYTSGTYMDGTWQTVSGNTGNVYAGQTANVSSATNNYYEITGVQLEVGTVPTPFEHRPLSVELAMCQRYYEKSFNLNTAPANNTSEQTVVYSHQQSGYGTAIPLSFRVRKRATASLIIYNPFDTTANRAAWIASSNQAFTHSDVHGITETGFTVINYSIPSGTTPDTSGNMIAFNWSADAEL